MDLFERQWQTYRRVVDHDWMEHRGITAASSAALRSWCERHPERHGEAVLLDLGCGDLALMGPVFADLPLGSYTGVDLTEQVLPLALAALGPVGFSAEFQHADIIDVVESYCGTADLIHASLVLHHLADDAKPAFLSALRRIVAPDGAFVWTDVFREPGESREDYVRRYAARIRTRWTDLDHDAREAIVTHMSSYDFPADRHLIVGAARTAGWDWQWLWHGTHRAEAVALLTPA